MNISGIVNIAGYMEYLVLQSTSLGLVIQIAEIISESIEKALLDFQVVNNLYKKIAVTDEREVANG